MAPIYAAETPLHLAQLAAAEGLEVVLELGQDREKSASKWTYRHLIAYRLLMRPPKPFLSTLKDHHDEGCSVCKPESPQAQDINREATEKLISGYQLWALLSSTHSDIQRFPAGSFWISLVRASNPEVLDRARVYPQRERQAVMRQGFVNSTQIRVGSSSPIQSSSPRSPSSEEADISMGAADEDENDARRRTPEELTVNLFNSLLEYILYVCVDQKPASKRAEVRVRTERHTSKANVAGEEITAQDDGGLCLALCQGFTWHVEDNFLAVLEAKKAFHCIEEKPKGGFSPVVSNETLAQYLAEAVITWKANPSLHERGVFLIAATSTFVRFMHFKFGSNYRDYLDATSVRQQKSLVLHDDDGQGERTFVCMESSEWYNLQSSEGRKAAICHMLALLRWHELSKPDHQLNIDLNMEMDSALSY